MTASSHRRARPQPTPSAIPTTPHPTHDPVVLTWDVLTDRARRLQRFLKQEQVNLPLHRCQTITARQHRFAGWHEASVALASIPSGTTVSPTQDARRDPADQALTRTRFDASDDGVFAPNPTTLAVLRAAPGSNGSPIAPSQVDPVLALRPWAPGVALVIGTPAHRQVTDQVMAHELWSWLLHHESMAPRLTLMAGHDHWTGLMTRWTARRQGGWSHGGSNANASVSCAGHHQAVNPFMLPFGHARPSIGHTRSLGLMVLHVLGRLPMERRQEVEGLRDAMAFVNELYTAYKVSPMRADPSRKSWTGLVRQMEDTDLATWADPEAWDRRLGGSGWRNQPWSTVRDLAQQNGAHELARIAHAQAMPCWADLLVAVDHEAQVDRGLDDQILWMYDATQDWGRRSPLDPRAFFEDWRTTGLNDWPEALERLSRTGLGQVVEVMLGAFHHEADHDSTSRTSVLHAWAWLNNRVRERLEHHPQTAERWPPEAWAIDLDLRVRSGARRLAAMDTPLMAALLDEISTQAPRTGVSLWRMTAEPQRVPALYRANPDRWISIGPVDSRPAGAAWTPVRDDHLPGGLWTLPEDPQAALPDPALPTVRPMVRVQRWARTPLDARDARRIGPSDLWMCPPFDPDRRWVDLLGRAIAHEDLLDGLARVFPAGTLAQAPWWAAMAQLYDRRRRPHPTTPAWENYWERRREKVEEPAWDALWDALLAARSEWKGVITLMRRDRHGWGQRWEYPLGLDL